MPLKIKYFFYIFYFPQYYYKSILLFMSSQIGSIARGRGAVLYYVMNKWYVYFNKLVAWSIYWRWKKKSLYWYSAFCTVVLFYYYYYDHFNIFYCVLLDALLIIIKDQLVKNDTCVETQYNRQLPKFEKEHIGPKKAKCVGVSLMEC